jgi:DNA-binding beta-propeller fold protein YncE
MGAATVSRGGWVRKIVAFATAGLSAVSLLGFSQSLSKTPLIQAHSQVMVVQESLNRVLIVDPDHPEKRSVIPVGEKPHEIEVSPDRKTAYVSNFGLLEANHKIGQPGTTISVIDVAAKKERSRFQLPEGMRAPHGLKIRPHHPDELFTNTEDGEQAMVVFDAGRGSVLRTFSLPPGVHNFVFSADGAECYAFTVTGEVLRLDPQTGHLRAQTAVPFVRGLSWTADHGHLLVGARGQLLLLDPDQLRVERTFGSLPVGQIFYPAASPDGRFFLAPAVLDGVLLVVNAQSGEVEQRLTTGSPLQAVFEGDHTAWISNVRVPASMLPVGAPERSGSLVRVDLRTMQTQTVPNTEDANGIAVLSAPES